MLNLDVYIIRKKGGYKVDGGLIIDEAEDARRIPEKLNLHIPKHKERKEE